MYRLLVITICAALFSGCASLENSEFLARAGDALSKIGQKTPEAGSELEPDQEVAALFEQPYIDPLTDYLKLYAGDADRAAQLERVREERERRCDAVDRRYNSDEITQSGLALYRRGYGYSCPANVAAYAAKLDAVQSEPEQGKPDPVPEAVATEAEPQTRDGTEKPANDPGNTVDSVNTTAQAQSQPQPADGAKPAAESGALSECYLLTRIRNFSAALRACQGPADNGAVGAQANMAQIHSALGNHESAHEWAHKAAPESAQAAHLLGEMYAQGRGVEQDRGTAVKWFSTAAELGHAGARDALDNIDSATAGANVD